MLSGEWAVLEIGFPCLVLAVNKRVRVSVHKSARMWMKSKGIGIGKTLFLYRNGKVFFKERISEKKKRDLIFMEKAVEIVLNYLELEGIKITPFSLEVTSDASFIVREFGKNKKIGLGSSAAVTVAVIGALLKFFIEKINLSEKKLLVFKLASLAHYLAQGKLGSSFDIAAASFGGLLYYCRFDPTFVLNNLKRKGLLGLVNLKWKNLVIEKNKFPARVKIAIGFVNKSSSTSTLLKKMDAFKKKEPDLYDQTLIKIKKSTLKLKQAILEEKISDVQQAVSDNHLALKVLSDISGVPLLTPELEKLVEIVGLCGGSGKFSGAGGGDVGIGICKSQEEKNLIFESWARRGIVPVEILPDRHGVLEEL